MNSLELTTTRNASLDCDVWVYFVDDSVWNEWGWVDGCVWVVESAAGSQAGCDVLWSLPRQHCSTVRARG